MTPCLAAVVALAWTLTVSPRVHADEPRGDAKEQSAPPAQRSAADVRKADALFQKARLLKKLGKEAEACPLFVESQSLDPSGGTLVNIAECHESEGKTGTAWRELLSALKLAKQTEDKDLVKGIRDRLMAIVPRLYQITIEIPKEVSAIPGVDLRLDDTRVSASAPTQVEVVDPGPHTVHASAPGHVDFNKIVILEGEQRSVSVLVSLAKPPPPPPPDHTLAWGLVIGGGAGVLAGAGLLGATAGATGDDQLRLGVGGSVMLAVGLGVLSTGIVLRATAAPPPPRRSVTRRPPPQGRLAVHPVVGPKSAFLGISGTF